MQGIDCVLADGRRNGFVCTGQWRSSMFCRIGFLLPYNLLFLFMTIPLWHGTSTEGQGPGRRKYERTISFIQPILVISRSSPGLITLIIYGVEHVGLLPKLIYTILALYMCRASMLVWAPGLLTATQPWLLQPLNCTPACDFCRYVSTQNWKEDLIHQPVHTGSRSRSYTKL